ncbi:MAG TPA: hypothetical protein VKU01_06360 [Bryobacteraceae bacterium]|nr:hypothetical protein [Bryobacteraceae bacterium]
MQRRFDYTYEDQSAQSKITFDYCPEGDELVRFGQADGESFLSANRSGFLALAKLFIKLAEGSYGKGFHIHLGEDFAGSDAGKTLMIAVIESAEGA